MSGPTAPPTAAPILPTYQPSAYPSTRPSAIPSTVPGSPTGAPSVPPSGAPSAGPTPQPTSPTAAPSTIPTCTPSVLPTPKPSACPSVRPSYVPSVPPTGAPTTPTASPSAVPSSPTIAPSAVPSSPTLAPTGYQLCAPYSATNTNYDTQNYASCYIYACPGATITASGCASTYAGAVCSGDQYLTLVSGSGVSLAVNDDYCGYCAQLSYMIPSTAGCQAYTLREGCYSSGSCTGTIRILGGTVLVPTAAPTRIPTISPTTPTAAPSPVPTTPTASPSAVPSSPTSAPSTMPSSAPSVSPTQLPTTPTCNPTPKPSACPSARPSYLPTSPTSAPSIGPTQVAQATGYVSQYVYDTSTCSGVPNAITAYSLGVCFPYSSYYVMYTASVQATSMTLTMNYYTNAACSVFYTSSAYTIVKACSSGSSYNYSTTAPVAPQSMATRYSIRSL